MPTYSFVCRKCKNNFLVSATFVEFDKKDPKKFRCPKCGSTKIKQNFGDFLFIKGSKNIRCRCGG